MGQYKYELLYKGSRDGFSHKKFHDLCDGQGATLTIIRSKDKDRFGGFTNIPWSSEGGQQADKGKSFLFSVRGNGSVVKLSHIYGSEVSHQKDFSVIFYQAFYVKFKENQDVSGFHKLKRYYQMPMTSQMET